MMYLRRHLLILSTLLAIFLAPGLLAFVFFQHPAWLGGTTNKGVLLSPPQRLSSDLMVKDKKWRLVFWNPSLCGASCMQSMDKLARIRLALGRYLYSVDILLLLDSSEAFLSADALKILHESDSHVLVLPAPDEASHTVLGNEPAIYIVNPQHDVILKYAAIADSEDVFHDIKQLVKDR